MRFEHRFVDGAPQTLEPGVLYVSIRHKSALHLCACGCGHEVVTPLAPHRWQLLFDGETVSLEPSVGNSVLPCRSHYLITKNTVNWHRPMTEKGIEWAHRRDQRAVEAAFGDVDEAPANWKEATVVNTDDHELHDAMPMGAGVADRTEAPLTTRTSNNPPGFWSRLRRLVR